MRFFNTSAGKWLVIMIVGATLVYIVYRALGGKLRDAAKEGASYFDFTDPNNNSAKAALKMGRSVFGSSWELADLFPKSSAERRLEAALRPPSMRGG